MTRYEKYLSVEGLAERKIHLYRTAYTFGFSCDVGNFNSSKYKSLTENELYKLVLEKEIEWLNQEI
jgi:hypothetical protein